ncbi:MAG: DUF4270 family protein [Bacteroidales bacterium]
MMKKKFFVNISIIAIVVYIFTACTNDSELTIGNQFIHSDATMVYTDTFSVSLSSFRMDSIQTSGNNLALVGQFIDSKIGTLTSQSYAIMGSNDLVLSENTELDSFVLILKPSGYYYGDTSAVYKIQVHEVTEDILLDKTSKLLYNNSSFEYDNNVLGEKEVTRPKPKSGKEIRIPINSDFSTKLFEKFKSSSKPFSDFDPFVNYFKGILLKTTEANSILGFSLDSIHFNMYYHARGYRDSTSILKIAPATAYTTYQFNNVETTNDGSVASSISEDPVSSTQVNNYAYLQGGSGIFTRVEFPSLKKLLLDDRKFEIIRADLVIQPSIEMDYTYLPEKLYIFPTNNHNDKSDTPIKDGSGNQVISTLYKDEIYKENTYYSWNITTYVQDLLYANEWDYNGIHIIPVDFESKFDHVIIADPLKSKYKTCLKLYLLYYE